MGQVENDILLREQEKQRKKAYAFFLQSRIDLASLQRFEPIKSRAYASKFQNPPQNLS